MAFGDDEEILQDFLVEAGEIIEQLSEQLVELEQSPDDKDLLNAIFRGFHTVKGGAGFLQLNAMVDCCHVTENLFDILRNGDREVSPELMDIVLQALDTVTRQFHQLQNGESPDEADPQLIHQLELLVAGEDLNASSAAVEPAQSTESADSTSTDNTPAPSVEGASQSGAEASSADFDMSDEEFEGFLDALDNKDDASASQSKPSDPSASVGGVNVSAAGDEITEEEFEALLDQLHGSGQAPTLADSSASAGAAESTGATSPDEISENEFEDLLDQLHGTGKGPGQNASEANSSGGGDLISDDEFENLLDELHGKGHGPTAAKEEVPAAKDEAAPEAKAEPVKAEVPEPSKAASVTKLKPRDNKQGNQQAAQVAQGETTVRVDTQRLDDIMNMVGELVLVRNRLVRLGEESTDESMQKAVGNLDVVTADLQTAVMKTRMQPIKKVFGRFPRVVRDLARNLKKEINLELKGEDTDLDKNLVEALADPLVHLVRNSVDHGIELPAERERNGKTRVGKVVLAAEQEGDHILLSISDDGAGMDPDKLRTKAVEKGIMDTDAASRLSDVEAYNLIFAPGFSTKTEISDVSGRGVGMDVVKTKITQLNGSIEIQSALGEGTRFNIKVPLTLAIMPTLMIMLGKQTFALPLVSVNEIFHMDLTKVSIVDGQECIVIREKTVPVFNLKHWLVKGGAGEKNPPEAHVVIVSVGTQRVGFIVDQLIGQEEVVIKPLGKLLHGTPGMAGATITGDGTIALILDVPSMLKRYAGNNKRVA
ncbi:chemotaxis protein CheA [Agaribacterium haliotis]|uniref:chemotaxis protein CheA n=1 Tax=Agaribacterium haliotis TaxID=2013869 RepID=UPI000BB52C2D|nr:chemotaxis protein CheA [Agaribacterium haliotis]